MLSRFKDRGRPSVLSKGTEVMDEENCVEDLDQVGYRSLVKIIQGCLRYIVWARSLADLETPDGFVNLVRVV
jgi:hypothetical protein